VPAMPVVAPTELPLADPVAATAPVLPAPVVADSPAEPVPLSLPVPQLMDREMTPRREPVRTGTRKRWFIGGLLI
jgi:hypothetical protein